MMATDLRAHSVRFSLFDFLENNKALHLSAVSHRLGVLCMLIITVFLHGLRADGAESRNRMSVAVMDFEDKTQEPESGCWRTGFQRLLTKQLGSVNALRLLPVNRRIAELNERIASD